jgi:phospholipase C
VNPKPTDPRLTINRREFLRGATLLGGAAGLTLPFGARHNAQGLPWLEQHLAGPSILDLPADTSPIDHIVVVMMENRSFDHYLGWLATDASYIEQGRSRYGADFSVDGDNSQVYRDGKTGMDVATYHLTSKPGEQNPYRGCGYWDPGHSWDKGRAQRVGGFLATGSGNDEFAVSYYLADDLPVYTALARRFTIFDRYHASLLGPTFPNREYLYSAQSGSNKRNNLPPILSGFPWQTIADKLTKARVSVRNYYTDLPTIGLWGPRMLSLASAIGNYFEDARQGKLPNVVFVDPAYVSGERNNDDHPHADIRAGQKFVYDVFKAFVESPHWRTGCFILTYDEWGGFFDHVPPPILPDDRASTNDQDNFGQAGFRVPVILASPYARPGFVDHRLYDHTSILRFIEWRFLGAPPEGPGAQGDTWYLTMRDRTANNIGASLTPDQFNPEVELKPPEQTISRPCPQTATQESLDASSAASLEEHDPFRYALESGYYESIGFKVNRQP